MKNLLYLRDAATIKLDGDKCTGCGACLEVCPHEVLVMNSRRVHIRNRDACMECGACSRNCPFNAVTVQAGVGCAAAVISSLTSGKGSACCGTKCDCGIEQNNADKCG